MASKVCFESLESVAQCRNELITREKEIRSDHEFIRNLSPTAKRACEIVAKIRSNEREHLFTTYPHLHPDVAMPTIRPYMQATLLYRIISTMPKGALLHAHHTALSPIEFILERVFETPGMYLYATGKVSTPEERSDYEINFAFVYYPSEPAYRISDKSLWDADYTPNHVVPVNHAADTFPGTSRAGFVEYMASRCTVTDSVSLQRNDSIDDIWKRFQTGGRILNSMNHNEPVFRACWRKTLEDLAEDNIGWVELRTIFKIGCGFFLEGDGVRPLDMELQMARVIFEECERFAGEMRKEEKRWWGVRLIWTGLRALGDDLIREDMEACMRVKEAYPELISGYDLVGQEKCRTLREHTSSIVWFRNECKRRKLNLPLFLHVGECNSSGDAIDDNFYDALCLGTRRIGQGFNLVKHPHLQDFCKDRKICVEFCPLSNEVLRLMKSIMGSTMPAVIANGVDACLGCDDPSLMGYHMIGQSMDFCFAIWAWDDMGLAGLGHLAQNSVRFSQFEDQSEEEWQKGIASGASGSQIKAERLRVWNKEWEEWCRWIVSEYADPWEPEHKETSKWEHHRTDQRGYNRSNKRQRDGSDKWRRKLHRFMKYRAYRY